MCCCACPLFPPTPAVALESYVHRINSQFKMKCMRETDPVLFSFLTHSHSFETHSATQRRDVQMAMSAPTMSFVTQILRAILCLFHHTTQLYQMMRMKLSAHLSPTPRCTSAVMRIQMTRQQANRVMAVNYVVQESTGRFTIFEKMWSSIFMVMKSLVRILQLRFFCSLERQVTSA